jgi:hypothetical protein
LNDTTPDQVRDALAEWNPDALTFDGFDEALIGVVNRFGQPPLALYSFEKIIEILLRDGGTYEEAVEYYEFNMIGAWVGEGTPAVAVTQFD